MLKALMAPLPKQGGPSAGLSLLALAALLNVILCALSSQSTAISSTGNEMPSQQQRVPHVHAYRVSEDIEGIAGEASAGWLELNAHQPLLNLALPATYMSTLTDVNVEKYKGKVEAQELGVADQLKDGIRLLDVRLWKSQKASDQTGWFTEVPWRLFEDKEALRKPHVSSTLSTLTEKTEALEVHSGKDLVDSLFKPVLQFLRKSISEVVVVVFSAVNGNIHTVHNKIAKGSDLGESLPRASKQLEAFLEGGGPYSDNEQDGTATGPGASTQVLPARSQFAQGSEAAVGSGEDSQIMRLAPESAERNPLLESFVKKAVSFSDFAEITGLIDTYWGQLLPRHVDRFLGSNQQPRRMRDSVSDPDAFRAWQRGEGAALLGKPISELRHANYVRLILFVDDPMLAWFITTRSRSQVVAFVKADHVYDVSFKSESYFAPCASPHEAIIGKPTVSEHAGWSRCRNLCTTMGPTKCLTWTWKPNQSFQGARPWISRPNSDLGSTWEETIGEESGHCDLFTSGRAEPSFEAISQEANCPFADLQSSDLPWDPTAVVVDLVCSVLPRVQVEAPERYHNIMRGVRESRWAFDPRVSLLTTGSATGHEVKYGISQKLIRILFAPPTPQLRTEAAERPVYSGASDVVQRFNAMLARFLLHLMSTYHSLDKQGIRNRVINAIQISKYHRIRSDLVSFSTATFFEHVMILNPSGAIKPYLLQFPQGSFAFVLEGAGVDRDSRSMPLDTGGASVTTWMCFLGVVITVSLVTLLSTFWCTCHPGSLFSKVCQRRASTGNPPPATVEVVGIHAAAESHTEPAT